MIRFAAAVPLLAGALWAAAPTVPYTLHDDFQANSLGQWASYPPVQDAGYDPSLTPTSEFGARGGRSLMRVIDPPVPGPLRFGFIKRLNAVSPGSVVLRFDHLLKPARAHDEIEIGLACANGGKLTERIAAQTGGAWSTASVRFQVPAGERIDAVFLVARVNHADPDIKDRFLIDNVELRAARLAPFDIRQPEVTNIDPWPDLIAKETFRPGQPIAIEATAPAACTLRDQDDHIRAQHALTRHGNAWTGSITIPAPGLFTLELRGGDIDSHIRLLAPRALAAHPRLYFGLEDAAKLRARARLPEMAPLWAHLNEMAEAARDSGNLADGGRITAMLDRRFLLPTLPGFFDFANRASNRISYNALVGYIEDNTSARAAAKQAMLEVAAWQTWSPPWFEAHGQHTYYPSGMLAADMALGYDLLYDELTPAERHTIRRALIEREIEPAWREYVLDNRVIASTSNWIAHTAGGALIALAAIYGDDNDPRLATMAGGLLRKLEDHIAASYLPGGSYGEGISYQEFDLLTLTMAITAADRVFGVDYWSHSNIEKSLAYQIHLLARPPSETQDMGDSHPPSGYSIAALVAHSDDPVVQWYYAQFPHRSITDFLFYPGARPQHAPAGPPSRLFPARGNAVFRTGWGPDDWILLFRAGPNFNHNHADQGSFLLRAFGENLAVDAGYADYYKDPYYATYFSQAAGHNTVLVDGDPASQSIADSREFPALAAYPHITSFLTSRFYDGVTSELSSVYQGRLRRFTRFLVFIKPRYLLVRDDITSAGAPARYDWLLHVNDLDALHASGTSAVYRGRKASLAVRAFSPTGAELTTAPGHLPYSTFNPTAPRTVPAQPGILDVRSAPSAATQFLIALAPARTPASAQAITNEMHERSGDNCTAIETTHETVAFRTAETGAARCGNTSADAAVWLSAADRLAGEQVRYIDVNGRREIESDTPLELAAEWRNNTLELSTNSPRPAHLRIFGRQIEVPAGQYSTRVTR